MNLQDIRELVDDNFWTNRCLLAMTAQVTTDQLNAPSSHNFSPLQRTRVHTLDTGWGWRVYAAVRSAGFSDCRKHPNILAGRRKGMAILAAAVLLPKLQQFQPSNPPPKSDFSPKLPIKTLNFAN